MSEFSNDTITCKLQSPGVYVFRMNFNKANAFNYDSFNDMNTALDWLDAQSKPFAVVLTGNGKFFSAGFDLKIMKQASKAMDLTVCGYEMLTRILTTSYPVICAIDGHAFGLGLLLSLACDFRVMTTREKAQLCFPEVNIGMSLSQPFATLGRSKLPIQTLFKAALTGYRWPGKEAQKAGMVDLAVPQEKLILAACKLAGQVKEQSKNPLYAVLKKELNLEAYTELQSAIQRHRKKKNAKL